MVVVVVVVVLVVVLVVVVLVVLVVLVAVVVTAQATLATGPRRLGLHTHHALAKGRRRLVLLGRRRRDGCDTWHARVRALRRCICGWPWQWV